MSKKPDIYFIRYDKERSGKRRIRLGLVGVGAIAQAKHIPSIMRLKTMWESSELIAVSDIDKKSGKKVADNFHINFYEEYREMIEKEELNGIIVTTPDTYHYEIARYALGKGLHVLVEKPLAMNTKEAKDLCLLAKNKGLILMTAFCKRYSEPYLRAKELISEGVLGDISMIAAKMCQGWAKQGLLERQHCHIFDILRFLGGDIDSMWAYGINKYQETDYLVDNVTVNFRFKSGAIGIFYGNSSITSYSPWERVEVYGKKNWLVIEDQYRVTLFDHEHGPHKYWEPSMPNTTFFDEEFGGYVGEIEDFICSIRDNKTPKASGWDGYKAIEIAEAIKSSIKNKCEVTLS